MPHPAPPLVAVTPSMVSTAHTPIFDQRMRVPLHGQPGDGAVRYDAHQHEHEKRDFDRAIPPRAADDLARCGSVITTDPALNPSVVMPRPQVASHFFSTVVLDECHRSRDRYADPQPSCAAGGNSASLAIKDIFLTESRIIVTPLSATEPGPPHRRGRPRAYFGNRAEK